MMKYLQKLGKALMLPVAALPVCGILMGIGYALAPAVMGAEGPTSGAAYTVGFLLIKAGGALIDNMAWLFAIGAAVGLSDDHDGTAGLAGLVSFLMMQQLLSPGVVGAVRTLEEGTVDYIAFSKIAGNSFIGILAAIIGAACYNKFKNTQLPDWLAFFSGKRSVAIVTAVVSIVVSVVLLFVWPIIFGALVALGNGIAKMERHRRRHLRFPEPSADPHRPASRSEQRVLVRHHRSGRPEPLLGWRCHRSERCQLETSACTCPASSPA